MRDTAYEIRATIRDNRADRSPLEMVHRGFLFFKVVLPAWQGLSPSPYHILLAFLQHLVVIRLIFRTGIRCSLNIPNS
jgi:hypothetical protein